MDQLKHKIPNKVGLHFNKVPLKLDYMYYREERTPLKAEEKSVTLEYDGRQVHTKSGEIIGKHSAV